MRQLTVVLLFCIALFATVSCAPEEKAKKEKYNYTDLPFEAEVSMEKGGEYSETATEGEPEPACSGISVKSFKLSTHEIPLKTNTVTSDCLIETKSYGELRLKIDSASYSYSILVTAKQEALFRKLVPVK